MSQKEKTVESCGGIAPLPLLQNLDTELVFILDRSGSMAGLEADTVGGFNAMIEKQRKKEGHVYVSTVLFDHVSEVLHDRVDIRNIKPMTEKEYWVRGNTALYDAIGGAIRHIANIHKYARPEDVPAHTVFVITTDGMENASRRYYGHHIRKMIEEKTEKYGWEFIFLAANIDAEEAARDIGIRPERAANYTQSPEGTRRSYHAMCEAITAIRDCCEDAIDLDAYLNDEDE